MIAKEIERHLWEITPLLDDPDTQRELYKRIQVNRTHDIGRHEIEGEEKLITLSPSRIKKASKNGCLRQLALQRDGAAMAEPHPGQILMRENGHQIHAMMLALLEIRKPAWAKAILIEEYFQMDAPYRVGSENVDIRLRCFVDLLILHDLGLDGLEWEIVDLKTVRGKAFYFEKEWPREDDQIQLKLNQRIAGARLEGPDGIAPITGGSIMYLDREGQNFCRVKDVELDKVSVGDEFSRAADVVTDPSIMPPLMPPKVTKKGRALPWQCLYCAWYKASCPGADIS